MESADRAGASALVQKQIEQIEHTEDERERGSMVLVRCESLSSLACAIVR